MPDPKQSATSEAPRPTQLDQTLTEVDALAQDTPAAMAIIERLILAFERLITAGHPDSPALVDAKAHLENAKASVASAPQTAP